MTLKLHLDGVILTLYGTPCSIKMKIINRGKFAFFNAVRKKYTFLLKTFLLTGNGNISFFLTPFWTKEFEIIKNELISNLNINFLRNKVLARTISVNTLPIIISPEGKSYLRYIQQYGKNEVSHFLIEDGIGKPFIISLKNCSSFVRIQHIYHLVKYCNETGNKVSDINSIIEWGGGYGDMATILARLNTNLTYTIIDHPYMSALQYIYAASVLKSTDRLNIVPYSGNIKKGYINFISLNNLDINRDYSAEMFISTFALTESNENSLDTVINHNFFNADKILIAYQSYNNDVSFGLKYSEIISAKCKVRKIPISSVRDFDYYLLK